MDNPYLAPTSPYVKPADEGTTYEPRLFAFSGRIGRLRYLAYSWAQCAGCGLLWALLVLMLRATGQSSSAAMSFATTAMYVVGVPVTFILARRRLNDLDKSGLLGFLVLLPFVNLAFYIYLLFGRGTAGTNIYGAAPSANSRGIVVASCLLPVFIVIAAMLLTPAYQAALQNSIAAQSDNDSDI